MLKIFQASYRVALWNTSILKHTHNTGIKEKNPPKLFAWKYLANIQQRTNFQQHHSLKHSITG
jgi:hypothetical protein